MKKFLIGLCLSSVLLAGCQKEKSTYVAKEDKIAISTTDFKDEDALKLVESVLKKHFPQYECTVTQTIIKGNNVYGIYTYQKNGRTVTQQVSLLTVSVNKNDSNDIIYLQSSFGAVDRHVTQMIVKRQFQLITQLKNRRMKKKRNLTYQQWLMIQILLQVNKLQRFKILVDSILYASISMQEV